MKRISRLVAVLIASALLSGCFGGGGGSSGPTVGGSNQAAVQSEIEALVLRYAHYMKEKDVDGILSLYDQTVLLHVEPSVEVSKEEFRTVVELRLGGSSVIVSVTPEVGPVSVSGSTATADVTFHMVDYVSEHDPVVPDQDKRKFTFIRKDGRWLIRGDEKVLELD